MPQVALSQGLSALVDEADLEAVSAHKWFAARRKMTWYAARHNAPGQTPALVYMHRDILATKDTVDHINGNGLDNRRANLRAVSAAENARNQRKRRRITTSAFKGVSFHKQHKRWRANICCNYKHWQLGYFDSEEAAARAYDQKAIELFGEYASLNFAQQGRAK